MHFKLTKGRIQECCDSYNCDKIGDTILWQYGRLADSPLTFPEVFVSTIFSSRDLRRGIDGAGPPLLLETAVFFPPSMAGMRWRYADYKAAEEGHARVLATFRAHLEEALRLEDSRKEIARLEREMRTMVARETANEATLYVPPPKAPRTVGAARHATFPTDKLTDKP